MNGRCYYYNKDKLSYDDALSYCQRLVRKSPCASPSQVTIAYILLFYSQGANLAYLEDNTEVEAVTDALDPGKEFWIGTD